MIRLDSGVHIISRANRGLGHVNASLQHALSGFFSLSPSPSPNQPTTTSFSGIHPIRVMPNRAAAIRKKFPQFRVLVIGRANAGKTTLLQRVCKTTESPIVRDRDGRKVTSALLCRR